MMEKHRCGSCGKKRDNSDWNELADFGFCFCKKCYSHLVDLIKKIEDLYPLEEAREEISLEGKWGAGPHD